MYVWDIYVRPDNLTAYRRSRRRYENCALENTTDFSCAQNSVSDSDGPRTVSGSEFRPGIDKASLSISLWSQSEDFVSVSTGFLLYKLTAV